MKKYRVYKELTNENGEVVHKMPVCSTTTLKMACSMARTNAGFGEVGIYEINADGTETKIK